jgi:hypothetical protein
MTIQDLLKVQCPRCKGSIPIVCEHDAATPVRHVSFQLDCPTAGCGWHGTQPFAIGPPAPSRE